MYFKLETLGDQLRNIRTANKWSQLEIALEADIDQSFYSMVERGRTGISLRNYISICAALKISPILLLEELLQLEDLLQNEWLKYE